MQKIKRHSGPTKKAEKHYMAPTFLPFAKDIILDGFSLQVNAWKILLLVLGLEEYHPVVKNQKIPHALGLWVQLSSLSSSKLIPSMGLVLWALLFQSTLSSQLSITPQSMMSFFITFEVWFNTSCRGRLWFCCTSSYHFKQHSSIIFCWNYCKFPFMCSFLVLSFLVIIDIPHSNAHLCNIYIHFSFLWSPTSRSI